MLAFETDQQALFLILEVADNKGDGRVFLENLLSECADKSEIRNAIIAKSDRERKVSGKFGKNPEYVKTDFHMVSGLMFLFPLGN